MEWPAGKRREQGARELKTRHAFGPKKSLWTMGWLVLLASPWWLASLAGLVRAVEANGTLPQCVSPPSGLVSWWPGDGNANDIVGTHHGTLMGNATYASGMVGQAFSFDGGEANFVEIPDSAEFNPSGAFSVDGWFYIDPAASGNAGEIATLVAKTEGSTGNGWALYFDDRGSTKDLKFIVGSNAILQNAILAPNWYHIAGVYDPSATPRTKLYLNGVNVADSGTSTAGMSPNGLNVRIGAMYWTDSYHQGNDRLNGMADEVEFFSRALSAEEIAAIYNAGSAGKCRSCVTPPSNMVSWWKGENNADDSIDGNNGTLVNGATFAPGKVGQAFSLDGVDDYISIPNGIIPSSARNFSVDAWVFANSVNLSGENHIVYSGPSGGGEFYLANRNGNFEFAVYLSGQGWYRIGVPADIGAWRHLTGVRRGTQIEIWVDGTLRNSMAIPDADLVTGPSVHSSLGSYNRGQYGFWDGLIDEVEIFNRALTAEEIAAIYNAGSAGKCRSCVTPPSNMVSWWKGENNADDSIDGNNGTMMNGATFAPGKVGQAFSLDGVGDRVSLPNFLPPDNITVDAWINLAGTSHTGGGASIWGVGTSGGIQASVLFVDAAMTHLYWDISTTDGLANRYLWSGAFTFSLNQWYHVAITQSGGPTSQPTMYVNGASLTVTNFMANGTPSHHNAPMAIGSYGGYTTQYFFEGLIDEVEIFNRALTAEEIAAIANAGSAGKCQGVSPPTADLALTKTDAPDPVTVGSDLTYTVTVTNNGPDPATGVTLIDALPAGVTFVSATSPCTYDSGVVTCDLGSLAKDASTIVTIVIKPTAPGSISNTADVTGNETDPDTSNNSATAGTTVNPPSCLGTGPYRMSGKVEMNKGDDGSGVTMTLVGPSGCTDTMTTAAEPKYEYGKKYKGTYECLTLGTGTYTVTPSKPGCTFTPALQTVTVEDKHKVRKLHQFKGSCP